MNWRETMGVKIKPYAQYTHNTQKPPSTGNCADTADNAYRGRKTDAETKTIKRPPPTARSVPETLAQYSKVRRWLAYIGETDHVIIDECLEQCRNNPKALAYYLKRHRNTNYV